MKRCFAHNGKATVSRFGSLETEVIEAMAEWCDALYGGASLGEAFACLAAGFGAEAGMLVRTHVSDCRPARIAVWDRRAASSSSPLTASFADGFFGRHLARPRAATLWLASTHEPSADDPADPALALWQGRRGLEDFASLVLLSGPPVRDHIELHFVHPVAEPVQAALGAVLPTMARTWASRQVGLVARTVVNHRPSQEAEDARFRRRSFLSPSNPARFSRAEFRVCLLLSRGLSVLGVAEELSVCESTVRSHLRSIYAKTGTTGLADLVFHLLATPPDSGLADRFCA